MQAKINKTVVKMSKAEIKIRKNNLLNICEENVQAFRMDWNDEI